METLQELGIDISKYESISMMSDLPRDKKYSELNPALEVIV